MSPKRSSTATATAARRRQHSVPPSSSSSSLNEWEDDSQTKFKMGERSQYMTLCVCVCVMADVSSPVRVHSSFWQPLQRRFCLSKYFPPQVIIHFNFFLSGQIRLNISEETKTTYQYSVLTNICRISFMYIQYVCISCSDQCYTELLNCMLFVNLLLHCCMYISAPML